MKQKLQLLPWVTVAHGILYLNSVAISTAVLVLIWFDFGIEITVEFGIDFDTEFSVEFGGEFGAEYIEIGLEMYW